MRPISQPALRAFLALDFDDHARRFLTAHLRRLRDTPWAGHVRWVRADNLHLTLRFLGDITPAQADHYGDAFGQGLAQIPRPTPWTLAVTSPRFFPHPAHPRLIACLVETDTTLNALTALAEACATAIGLTPETRPFRGHITLGRMRDTFPHNVHPLAEERPVHLRPAQITLYKSQLDPRGAIYTPLRAFSATSQP
ncbi:MAG: RNA 2',3'-cyclic phosphodiesterase [Chloroflexi bacterium]|jgi:2'-5' RNA ligase|uniref:RNA 2',3'-cyclic phosphodiesterase n=1 Tax=Candidatus Thermofonsia Clade 3 bacterium TaxID=2364212 RepID=A0A2M8QBI8_9CHLR|nr:RNA 2',3'-cyclic phosphodiesterase [Candidatus Roseilinea sp. NK_OTU-006]PJF47166.1 MAG: RNA 2',3'-cyclic phosphodiesterase [Candidatus Thermofonsia Clade 3 bacterium]RMG65751.1 MAG: RNA 2',3'-cyclic phosphodiesterase [Chloroflexota bacterium]